MHRLPRGLGWRSEAIRPGAVLVNALAVAVVLVLKHIIVMNHERKDLTTEPARGRARRRDRSHERWDKPRSNAPAPARARTEACAWRTGLRGRLQCILSLAADLNGAVGCAQWMSPHQADLRRQHIGSKKSNTLQRTICAGRGATACFEWGGSLPLSVSPALCPTAAIWFAPLRRLVAATNRPASLSVQPSSIIGRSGDPR